MGLLAKLFYRPPPYKAFVPSIQYAANEMERTFRGMLTIYNEDIKIGILTPRSGYPVEASPQGIFKARMFASKFWPTAYQLAYDSVEDNCEFIGVVIKTARMGTSLDRASLGAYGEPFSIKITPIIENAFKAGPMILGAPFSPAHVKLVEILHELLADEIGTDNYSQEVRGRLRLPVEANVLRLLNDPMELFRRSDARDPNSNHSPADQEIKLITLKCQYCGLSAKMPNDALLILEKGPTDVERVNHFHLYCRSCHMVSDLIGTTFLGLLQGRKFEHQQILDPALLAATNPQLLNLFSPKIQAAMQADGIM